MTRSERKRAEKRRREQQRLALLAGHVDLVYALPLVSGLIMWWVSGSIPLALAILGAGLAAISTLLARYYGLQLEGGVLADDLGIRHGQHLS